MRIMSVGRLVAIFLMLGVAVASAQDLPARFDPARDAAKDVATAAALAKAQGKRVLVDVGGEWCAWCHILDRFIAANRDVKALVDANYVWVKVNWSRENKNEALLSKWPAIRGYPHLFVLDSDARLLHSQETDVLEAVHDYDRARFSEFLRRWAPPRGA